MFYTSFHDVGTTEKLVNLKFGYFGLPEMSDMVKV
jgi:hypothetical protein